MEQVQKQLNGQTGQRGEAAEAAERGEPGGKGTGKEKFSLSSDSRGAEAANSFCAFFLCLIYNVF
jgi:hypothetical protein